MPEKMVRYLVQVVAPDGAYDGCDELIEDLTMLLEGDSEIEVVSAEEDPEQPGEVQDKC